jgi:ankyrin repeat protein
MLSCQTSIIVSKLAYKHEVLEAVSRRDVKSVQHYLSLGFPINSDLNDSGWTLLHVAAHNGDLVMLEALVERGAALNIRDFEEKWSPVMAAVMNDHPLAVKLLQAAGADMRLKDKNGRTAVDLARSYRCDKVKTLWSERSGG